MYAAKVVITINQFVPANYSVSPSPSCNASLTPPQDISPKPVSGMFTQKGNCIVVTVPDGYKGSVQLIYQLPDPRYVLLGAMFIGPQGGAGRTEFQNISLVRDLDGSQMTVTDKCDEDNYYKTYTYSIILQEVSSGNIGIIDPDEETDPVDPPVGSGKAKVPSTPSAPAGKAAPPAKTAPPTKAKR